MQAEYVYKYGAVDGAGKQRVDDQQSLWHNDKRVKLLEYDNKAIQ